jgi:protein O-mannosyl-transferase
LSLVSRRFSVLVAAAAFGAQLNAFRGAFQFDDFNVIVDNPAVHSFGAWIAGAAHGIRPLLKLTYMLNWTSGAGLFGFHLFNAAVHAANAVLVYLLGRRMFAGTIRAGEENETAGPLLAALLFAVHPVQTESVTYVCGRSMSLMALLYLGSMWAYVRGVESNRWMQLRVVSPGLFALAVLTKEVAVTLPAALCLWEAARGGLRARWGEIARRQSVHWLALTAAAVGFFAHAGYRRLLLGGFAGRTVFENLLSQVHGVSYLLSRLVMVQRLNIDPDLAVARSWTAALAAEAVFLGVLLVLGAVAFRKARVAGFGILWFLLQILPTNSVVPRLDVANEREMYLAAWGIFLVVGQGLDAVRASGGRRAAFAGGAAFVLVIVLAAFTVGRNGVYRSEVALWEATARLSPGKPRVQNNLGYAYQLAGMPDRAERAYQEALRLDGSFRLARGNLDALHRMERDRVRTGARGYR